MRWQRCCLLIDFPNPDTEVLRRSYQIISSDTLIPTDLMVHTCTLGTYLCHVSASRRIGTPDAMWGGQSRLIIRWTTWKEMMIYLSSTTYHMKNTEFLHYPCNVCQQPCLVVINMFQITGLVGQSLKLGCMKQ
jgi:hypothetical protein